MEYRYALERKKPIIGFCHKNISALPISKGEQSDQGKKRLETFRDLVKNKPCRFWETSAELGSQVSRSLIKLIKTNPSVGWVRGDSIPDHSTMEEILKLRRRIEELELELVNNKSAQPSGSGDLAQGAELYNVTLNFKGKETKSPWTEYNCIWHLDISWDEIFGCVSPLMIDEANEREMRYAISKFLQLKSEKDIQKHKDLKLLSLSSFIVSDADFHTIKIQLRALGLITKSTKSRSVKDTLTYWTLTAYGDDVMTKLRAIKKAQDEN